MLVQNFELGDLWDAYGIVAPETLNILYLEQNLIFSSEKTLTMFRILPDVRN